MNKTYIHILLVTILSTISFATDDICKEDLSLDKAVGTYSLKIGPGTMSAMGTTMPYTHVDTIPVKIMRIGKELHLEGNHKLNMVFDELGLNNPKWDFRKDLKIGISKDDLVLAVGCDSIYDMPAFFANGTGSFLSDVGTVPTQMGLVVYMIHSDGVSAIGGMRASEVVKGRPMTMNLKVELTPR